MDFYFLSRRSGALRSRPFLSPTFFVFLFCALFFTSLLHAQNPERRGSGSGTGGGGRAGVPPGSLNGTVVDGVTGEAIPGATVALWRGSDSTLVTGAIVKVNGTFLIEGIRPGIYYLKITSLGYLPLTLPDVNITRDAPVAALGTIRMTADESSGDEVTINADRSDIEFRADRTVYNVENQPINAGGNAVDVLKNVPQIEVDIDDNISLRGSQNVVVLVNGRSVPLTGDALAGYLRGLSSEGIKSIEVIPNPSAKYDPDGMAGIINIVLAKDEKNDNLSGSITVGAGTNNNYNTTGSLNWQTGKFTLFSSYGFRYDERESYGTLFRENRLLNPVTFLDQSSENLRINRSHVLNTTLEYAPNTISSFSISALLSARSGLEDGSVNYNELNASREIASQTTRFSPGDNSGFDMDYSLGYRWIKEASRNEFTAEARLSTNSREDFEHYTERSRGVPDTVVELQNSNDNDDNLRASLQLDYVLPLGKNGTLQTGYKGELNSLDKGLYSETFNAESGEFQPDIDRNNTFVYDQQVHALYAIVDRKFGKFDAQIGLRAEQAMTDFDLTTTGQTFSKDYFSLFPSGSLLWQFSESQRLRLNYSKRINRPRVRELNPFPQYDDRLNLRVGNPYLDPEYIHSIELGFNQFTPWGSVSLSPYFRRTTNKIERFLTIDTNGITTLTNENFNSSDSYGTELVGTYRIKDKLSGFVNLSLYRIVLNGDNIDASLSNDAFSWSTRVNGTYTILPGFDVQASWFYRAPAGISNGKIAAMQGVDLAVKKTLFSDQASLSLRVSDLFDTRGFSMWRDDPQYYIESERHFDSRTAVLSFSWNFGQQKKKSQQRQTNTEERESNEAPTSIDF